MSIPEVTTKQSRLLTVNINDSTGVPILPEGTTIFPLFLDRENGVWVLYAKFKPGVTLHTHFHTGTVHFFTTKGVWNYVEHTEDPQTAGSYLYEPGGSVHTFSVPPDAKEDAEGFMVVYGANVNFETANTTAFSTPALSKNSFFGQSERDIPTPCRSI